MKINCDIMKMNCDICKEEYEYREEEIHHHTIVIDGKLNTNTKVCVGCEAQYNLKAQKIDTVTTGELSNKKAKQIIDNEGVGYAVQHYIDGSEFSDPQTVKLWNKACSSLDDLEEYLGDFDED